MHVDNRWETRPPTLEGTNLRIGQNEGLGLANEGRQGAYVDAQGIAPQPHGFHQGSAPAGKGIEDPISGLGKGFDHRAREDR